MARANEDVPSPLHAPYEQDVPPPLPRPVPGRDLVLLPYPRPLDVEELPAGSLYIVPQEEGPAWPLLLAWRSPPFVFQLPQDEILPPAVTIVDEDYWQIPRPWATPVARMQWQDADAVAAAVAAGVIIYDPNPQPSPANQGTVVTRLPWPPK